LKTDRQQRASSTSFEALVTIPESGRIVIKSCWPGWEFCMPPRPSPGQALATLPCARGALANVGRQGRSVVAAFVGTAFV
jgi:hypothetical protein